MNQQSPDDAGKKAKNIAAIFYLLVLAFLVGGSYLHQNHPVTGNGEPAASERP